MLESYSGRPVSGSLCQKRYELGCKVKWRYHFIHVVCLLKQDMIWLHFCDEAIACVNKSWIQTITKDIPACITCDINLVCSV